MKRILIRATSRKDPLITVECGGSVVLALTPHDAMAVAEKLLTASSKPYDPILIEWVDSVEVG